MGPPQPNATALQTRPRQTFGKGKDLKAFSTRLAALGRVQGLIGDASNDRIDLAEIIRLELQEQGWPFVCTADPDKIIAAVLHAYQALDFTNVY
jgi:hypothetical protein